MKHEIKTQWKGDLLFHADSMGGSFDIDAAESVGGTNKGLRPKALMLTSLAGCSGIDIASLLKKMRAEVEGMEIDVSAELTTEHPKYYNKVHVTYRFYGKEFKKDKIEKAVQLSIDKYCGVIEMFRKFAEITTEIIYLQN
jgi:putative redox protein